MADRCAVCGLWFEPDPGSRVRCVAKHALGVCCHLGQWLIAEQGGGRFRAAAWPDCVIVDKEPTVTQLENESSVGAGVCSCEDAECTVRLVERAGVIDTVMRCTACGDTRVIHSKVPR